MNRILIINPNTSATVSALIRDAIAGFAPEDIDLRVVTAPFGAESLETPAEGCIAAHAVLTALADHHGGCAAMVIGAFSDPGLDAARDLIDAPVIGTGEASMEAAGERGRRYAIITLGPQMEPAIRINAVRCGQTTNLVGVRFLDASVLGLAADRSRFRVAILAAARDCIEEGARAIVLGGAPFTGMGADLGAVLGVPVLAGLEPAVRQAITLATEPTHADRARRKHAPTLRPAAGKHCIGLPDSLVTLLYGQVSQMRTS